MGESPWKFESSRPHHHSPNSVILAFGHPVFRLKALVVAADGEKRRIMHYQGLRASWLMKCMWRGRNRHARKTRQSDLRKNGPTMTAARHVGKLFSAPRSKARPLPCRAVPCRAVPCRAVPCRAVRCGAGRRETRRYCAGRGAGHFDTVNGGRVSPLFQPRFRRFRRFRRAGVPASRR